MLDLTDEQIDEAAFRMAMEDTREDLMREAEAQRGTRLTVPDPAWLDAEHATTDLAGQWEAASGEGQVVS